MFLLYVKKGETAIFGLLEYRLHNLLICLCTWHVSILLHLIRNVIVLRHFCLLAQRLMSGHSSHGRPLSASGRAAPQSDTLETSQNGEFTFSHLLLSVKYL